MTPPNDAPMPDGPKEVWLQVGFCDEGETTWCDHSTGWGEELGPYTRSPRTPAAKAELSCLSNTGNSEKQNRLSLKGHTLGDVRRALEALDLLRKRAYSHAEKSNGPKQMRDWIDLDVETIKRALLERECE